MRGLVRAGCWALALAPLMGGCGTAITLEVLKPAEVYVPTHIQTVAYVDRSKAKNIGQGILGALEGALSGEAIGADTEGRKAAGAGVVQILRESPRFEVVLPNSSNKQVGSSLFDKTVDWAVAARICRQAACEGIVALEAFDSDTSYDVEREVYTVTEDDKEVKKVRWNAERSTTVLTAWRVYDVESRVIVDDVRDRRTRYSWTGTGKTKADALANLPSQTDTVVNVGARAGRDFGVRIAPVFIVVRRGYYGGKDPRLKVAASHVRALDWQGAVAIWLDMTANEADTKLRGMAEFNLGLAAEVDGDLATALAWVQKAAVSLRNNGKSQGYLNTLVQRQRELEVLRDQMAAPPTPAPRGDALAIPADQAPAEGGGGRRTGR